MVERFFYWAGVFMCTLLVIGLGAMALEWAINRVVRVCGVSKLVLEFMWERARQKRGKGQP